MCLESGSCLHEDNPQGSRASAGLDWYRPRGYLLRREKKGLQMLVRSYWQCFCEMHTQYWLSIECEKFVFWSFVGSRHSCCRSPGSLPAFQLSWVHITDQSTWNYS